MAPMKMVVLGMVVMAALLQSSAAQTTHVVGDSTGWTIPPGGAGEYPTWASEQTFTVGDVLVFNFQNGTHDVAEVTKAAYDSCNASGSNPITTGPARITLSSAGEAYFICTFNGHCSASQKLAVNVSASASPAPQPAAATPSPTSAPAPAPSSSGQTYTVGDGLGWVIPPSGSAAYETWASNKTFRVGDTLVFNFQNGTHDVAEVSNAAYDSCNASGSNPITTGPARITLSYPGEIHFICTFNGHCSAGQKLAINVTGTSTSPPPSPPTPPSPSAPTPSAPSPSGSTTPPPPGSTTPPPSGSTTPPAQNGAPSSLAAAALPITLLSVALALLH